MSRLVVQHPALTRPVLDAFAAHVGQTCDTWQDGVATWRDVTISGDQLTSLAEQYQVDAEITPPDDPLGNYRLIVFDMDSTLITIECIDEIADFAGNKPQVAAITEAAMRGEIDFAGALRERVALLRGLDTAVLERVYQQRLRLSPGAPALIETAHRAGLQSLIVSGGFTWFTGRLADELGMHHHRANNLEIRDNQLTGRTTGPVIDAQAKADTVRSVCAQVGCSPSQTIVIGDGANDLKMMSIAGVSVAYHAKPVVRNETTHAVNHCGLDAILHYFQ